MIGVGVTPVLALGQVTSSGLFQVQESVPRFFTLKESEVAGLGQGEESPSVSNAVLG